MIVYGPADRRPGSGDQVSRELLVRMRIAGSRVGILGPDAFLPAAERFDLVQSIDTWMVAGPGAPGPVPRSTSPRSPSAIPSPAGRSSTSSRPTPEAARRTVFEITETAAPYSSRRRRSSAPRSRPSAVASRSTTSASASAPSPTFARCRSATSRSTAASSSGWPTRSRIAASCGASSASPRASASKRSPRESRTSAPWRSFVSSTSTRPRATCSAAPRRCRSARRNVTVRLSESAPMLMGCSDGAGAFAETLAMRGKVRTHRRGAPTVGSTFGGLGLGFER